LNNFARVALFVFTTSASVTCWAQTPTTEVVEFRSGEVALSGTFLLPADVVAAMVIVHGSGQEKRMMPFAKVLADHGIATLTYDKRGVGKSGGIYAGPEVGTNNVDPQNLDLLASDAAAALRELARRLPRDRVPVGLIGFSQAGWIIPIAATRSPEAEFIILWSGPLVTTLEQLRFQFLTEGKANFWNQHSEAEAREHVRSDPDRYQFTGTDPRESLQRLSIPGLWLYGGRDVSVPTSLSMERLQALAASGKPFEYIMFPESGHNLRDADAIPATMEWLRNTVIQTKPRHAAASR
jgi:pimeloyl-ACP methyl ester carboxylesterase